MATACAATLDPVALVEAMSAKLVSNRQITDDAIENAKELCRWTLETLSSCFCKGKQGKVFWVHTGIAQ